MKIQQKWERGRGRFQTMTTTLQRTSLNHSYPLSPVSWTLTGTPWDMRVLGFMRVTSWWRRSGWLSKSSGVSFFITSSKCSAASEGTPYQVFGSPLSKWKGDIESGHTHGPEGVHPASPGPWVPNSPVEVVNGITPVILNVPAKGWEDHAYIEPGHLHARDVCIDVAQYGLLQHWHHVQVPATGSVLLSGEAFVGRGGGLR